MATGGFENIADMLHEPNRNASGPSLDLREQPSPDSDQKHMRTERILRKIYETELVSWNQITECLYSRSSGVPRRELDFRINSLFEVTNHLLGPNQIQDDLKEAAASFLIQMFHDSFYANQNIWTTDDYREHLSSVFDKSLISNPLINTACDHCEFLLNILEESEDLNHLFSVKPNASMDEDEKSQKKKGLWSLLNYDNGAGPSSGNVSSSDEDSRVDQDNYDAAWLYTSLRESHVSDLLGLSIEDLMEMLRTNLDDSAKSNQEIGEDLLGLLGEVNVALIRDIISNRKSLVWSFKQLYEFEENAKNGPIFNYDLANLLKTRQKQPVFCQSIVVQTEEEKRLHKMLRKYQRKGKRGAANVEKQNENMEALQKAMKRPLFKEAPKPPKYPYVFDSFNDARQSAAFVSGHKMVIPVGSKREDNKRYEEMTIPAPSKPPDNVVETFKLVEIKELDQICQMGFAKMERLNQIQSIVYETAYKTNENMLVCAPTGAGKTNIAMLSILHEIKKHLNPDGSIRTDKFKIIYVAPMKALVSEMVENFGKRLKPMGVSVRELTGDMQLTRVEIFDTQMIVTTPEKWDVITRKTSGIQLLQNVKLTIIDEIHILESDRGPVLEALVARIIRNVESTQQMSRLVGLSATLPNYMDVAELLSVSNMKGLFFFDSRFRPVPLELSFVGIKALQNLQQMLDMDEVCYEKVRTMVIQGHQVMVFVHARNATYKVAKNLRNEAYSCGDGKLFPVDDPEYLQIVSKAVDKARNKMLKELIPDGFAIHHAGLLRADRNLVEQLFKDGGIKVLVCTSTLAWGVNLPAHAVVIRGTEMYDPSHGGYIDISMLDVMQIFGRAGRPQYDTEGYACIITSHEKLRHYLSMLTNQFPIESSFLKHITDNLNAEIVAETITTIDDAVEWISYTYLFIRMKRNPLVYGLSYDDIQKDPQLINHRRRLIIEASNQLHDAKMIRFDHETERLEATDLGRTASHFYIKYDTVLTFNEMITQKMTDDQLLAMICRAQEFDQLKSREDEMDELLYLQNNHCKLKVPEGIDSRVGKVNVLLQSQLSRARLDSFSLISDAMFINQVIRFEVYYLHSHDIFMDTEYRTAGAWHI